LEEFTPTASQLVALEQATLLSNDEDELVRKEVPDTVRAVPGIPLVMVTTATSSSEFSPTATQLVALEQATTSSSEVA
jgi:hypothetical protein